MYIEIDNNGNILRTAGSEIESENTVVERGSFTREENQAIGFGATLNNDGSVNYDSIKSIQVPGEDGEFIEISFEDFQKENEENEKKKAEINAEREKEKLMNEKYEKAFQVYGKIKGYELIHQCTWTESQIETAIKKAIEMEGDLFENAFGFLNLKKCKLG